MSYTTVLIALALAGTQSSGQEAASTAQEAEAATQETAEASEGEIVVEGEIDERHVKKCRWERGGINSRIPKKVCRSQAEDEAYEKAAKAQVEDMQNGQRAREMADINTPG